MIFYLFYIVPAALSCLVFWALWKVARTRIVSLVGRRALFVFLSVSLLAPVMVPAATIYVAWVPHSVILLTPDLSYYVQFAKYVLVSFLLTGLVAYVLARWRLPTKALPQSPSLGLFVTPVVIFLLIFAAIQYVAPDREIPEGITKSLLEERYGADLDDVIALLKIENEAEQLLEVDRIKEQFRNSPEVLYVSLQDPGSSGAVYGGLFYYSRRDSAPSKACSGVHKDDQRGLMRCTWKYGTFDTLDVLRYQREFEFGEEILSLIVEYDYPGLLEVVE